MSLDLVLQLLALLLLLFGFLVVDANPFTLTSSQTDYFFSDTVVDFQDLVLVIENNISVANVFIDGYTANGAQLVVDKPPQTTSCGSINFFVRNSRFDNGMNFSFTDCPQSSLNIEHTVAGLYLVLPSNDQQSISVTNCTVNGQRFINSQLPLQNRISFIDPSRPVNPRLLHFSEVTMHFGTLRLHLSARTSSEPALVSVHNSSFWNSSLVITGFYDQVNVSDSTFDSDFSTLSPTLKFTSFVSAQRMDSRPATSFFVFERSSCRATNKYRAQCFDFISSSGGTFLVRSVAANVTVLQWEALATSPVVMRLSSKSSEATIESCNLRLIYAGAYLLRGPLVLAVDTRSQLDVNASMSFFLTRSTFQFDQIDPQLPPPDEASVNLLFSSSVVQFADIGSSSSNSYNNNNNNNNNNSSTILIHLDGVVISPVARWGVTHWSRGNPLRLETNLLHFSNVTVTNIHILDSTIDARDVFIVSSPTTTTPGTTLSSEGDFLIVFSSVHFEDVATDRILLAGSTVRAANPIDANRTIENRVVRVGTLKSTTVGLIKELLFMKNTLTNWGSHSAIFSQEFAAGDNSPVFTAIGRFVVVNDRWTAASTENPIIYLTDATQYFRMDSSRIDNLNPSAAATEVTTTSTTVKAFINVTSKLGGTSEAAPRSMRIRLTNNHFVVPDLADFVSLIPNTSSVPYNNSRFDLTCNYVTAAAAASPPSSDVLYLDNESMLTTPEYYATMAPLGKYPAVEFEPCGTCYQLEQDCASFAGVPVVATSTNRCYCWCSSTGSKYSFAAPASFVCDWKSDDPVVRYIGVSEIDFYILTTTSAVAPVEGPTTTTAATSSTSGSTPPPGPSSATTTSWAPSNPSTTLATTTTPTTTTTKRPKTSTPNVTESQSRSREHTETRTLFRFIPPAIPVPVSESLQGSAMVVSTVTGAANVVLVQQLQRNTALLKIVRCGKDGGAAIEIASNPTQLEIGSDWRRYHRGVVIGNSAIALGALMLYSLALPVLMLGKWKMTLQQAILKLRFPSYIFVILAFLAAPTAISGAVLFWYGDGVADVMLMVFLGMFLPFLPLVALVIIFSEHATYVFPLRPIKVTVKVAAKSEACSTKLLLWLYWAVRPTHKWPEQHPFIVRYFPIFYPMSKCWFPAFDWFITVAVSIMAGLAGNITATATVCISACGVTIALLVVHFLVLVALRPNLARSTHVVQVSLTGFSLVNAILSMLILVGQNAGDAMTGVASAQNVVVIVGGVFAAADGGINLYELLNQESTDEKSLRSNNNNDNDNDNNNNDNSNCAFGDEGGVPLLAQGHSLRSEPSAPGPLLTLPKFAVFVPSSPPFGAQDKNEAPSRRLSRSQQVQDFINVLKNQGEDKRLQMLAKLRKATTAAAAVGRFTKQSNPLGGGGRGGRGEGDDDDVDGENPLASSSSSFGEGGDFGLRGGNKNLMGDDFWKQLAEDDEIAADISKLANTQSSRSANFLPATGDDDDNYGDEGITDDEFWNRINNGGCGQDNNTRNHNGDEVDANDDFGIGASGVYTNQSSAKARRSGVFFDHLDAENRIATRKSDHGTRIASLSDDPSDHHHLQQQRNNAAALHEQGKVRGANPNISSSAVGGENDRRRQELDDLLKFGSVIQKNQTNNKKISSSRALNSSTSLFENL